MKYFRTLQKYEIWSKIWQVTEELFCFFLQQREKGKKKDKYIVNLGFTCLSNNILKFNVTA